MIFDRYLLKNLGLATFFTAMSLAAIIMLTQSLRFLELVINSGASAYSFFVLTLLTLPRFFEVILPIALMIGTVFIYNKMVTDSEIVVMRTSGFSPLRLARPALLMSAMTAMLVFLITSWVAPLSISKMQVMRVTIKAQYSNLLLRDGIFNQVGNNLTVYIRNRGKDGALEGLMIHDTRDSKTSPVTVIAKRGVIVSDNDKQQVLVYNGSRQQFDPQKGVLSRLDFERYALDLPESKPVSQRWREPDERTMFELLWPDEQARKEAKVLKEFRTEIHRRLVGPFLAMTYTLLSLCCLLLGDFNRRGLGLRIALATMGIVLLQGLYLVAYNFAKDNALGLVFMYLLVFAPLIFCFYLLCPQSENMRVAMSKWVKGMVA